MNILSRIAVFLFAVSFLLVPAVTASEKEILIVKELPDSGAVYVTHVHVEEHASHDIHTYISPFTRSRVTEIEDILTDDSFEYYEEESAESLEILDDSNATGVPSPE